MGDGFYRSKDPTTVSQYWRRNALRYQCTLYSIHRWKVQFCRRHWSIFSHSFSRWCLPNSREIPTKFDQTAVQGHPRSSISESIESSHATCYYSL